MTVPEYNYSRIFESGDFAHSHIHEHYFKVLFIIW